MHTTAPDAPLPDEHRNYTPAPGTEYVGSDLTAIVQEQSLPGWATR